jgi:hypothetical protein
VVEWYEVHGFGETVNDGEQHRLAVDAREALDEVHTQISPNRRGDLKGAEKTGRLQVFGFIPLANWAGAHEVLDGDACTRYVEISPKLMHHLGDALMASSMG